MMWLNDWVAKFIAYINIYIYIYIYINPSTLIRVIRKNKKLPRERERERERVIIVFMWGKYELNGRIYIKFIINKMGRRIVKL